MIIVKAFRANVVFLTVLASVFVLLNFIAPVLAQSISGTADTAAQSPYLQLLKTVLDTIVSVAIAWASKKFSDRTGLDIDSDHRDALHSAIMTGLNYALSQAAAGKIRPLPSELVKPIADYVTTAVPDALDHFQMNGAKGQDTAKLSQMIDARIFDVANSTTTIVPNIKDAFASFAPTSAWRPMNYQKALGLVTTIISKHAPGSDVKPDDKLEVYHYNDELTYSALGNEIHNTYSFAFIKKDEAFFACVLVSDVAKLMLTNS